MTIFIADNSPRISYTVAAGVTQTSFTVPFEFFDDGNLNVYVDDVLQTLTTDYTVTGGSGSTGSISMSVTGASGGSTVVITRDVTLERTTDFPASGPFQVNSLNLELDKIVAMIADMKDLADRGLRLSDSDTSATLIVADKDSRKGTVLAFNATTGAVEVGPTIADVNTIADVTTDIATLADIEDGTDATNAIQTLAAIATNVTTVAGISASVTQVAGLSTAIQLIETNITAVQNASANATAAATSASQAAASATAASDSETAASVSETNAATSATNAQSSANSAATSATAATAQANAAATSATNAASSATSASTSATNASNSATAAATSESNAASSASAASTSATNAATSATNAAASETAAATSATNAATSETNAATSASNAATSATNAATSESNASTSETNAAASATSASTSATNAATSETNAATSASGAATSATNAATSASNAASSATSASSAQSAAESARDATLAAYDSFDDRYLGVKSSAPTLDNDGNALVAGALYFDSTSESMQVYTGSSWVAAYVSGTGFAALTGATFTGDVTVPNLITSGNVDGRDVSADGTKLDGIETGATADQTAAEIKTAYESNANTNAFTDAEQTKLSGIETGATADQTASEILTAIKTVDGSGSGLDADTVDGLQGTDIVEASDGTGTNLDTAYDAKMFGYSPTTGGTKPNGSGYGQGISIVSSGKTHNNSNNWISQLAFSTSQDDMYFRSKTNAGSWGSWYEVWHNGNDGAGSGLDADTLDGVQGSSYLRSDASDTYAGTLTLDGRLIIQNDGVSGQGDNNTHFNYNGTGVNYIRGVTTNINGTTLNCNAKIEMSNLLDMNNYDIYGVDQIFHHGDTNTYMQFHTSDQWRVVTGGAERIEVSGSALQCQVEIRSTANIIAYYSDERLKTKVGNIDSPLDKVMSLEGFYYVENDLAKSYGFDSDKQQVALSAQSVEAVMPEAVHPAPFDTDIDENGNDFSKSGENYLTVDYARLVPLLVEAIKELKSEVEELKNGSAN